MDIQKTIVDQILSFHKNGSNGYFQFWDSKNKIINNRIEFDQLWSRSLSWANYLERKGVKEGDYVAIFLPTGPDFIELFLSIWILRAVPCALYPPVRLGHLEGWKSRTRDQLELLDPFLIVTNKIIAPFLNGLSLAKIVSPLKNDFDRPSNFFIERVEKNTVRPDDNAFIQFSSGTTGLPKAVVVSHHSLVYNLSIILNSFPLTQEKMSCVSWLPLYHDMGLVGTFLAPIWCDGPCTLLGPEHFLARPYLWPKLISETKATISVGPNFGYALCAKRTTEQMMRGLDLSSWKIALVGSELVHPSTMRQFVDKFSSVGFNKMALTPVYGMAEATLAVSFSEVGNGVKSSYFDADKLHNEGLACKIEKHQYEEKLLRPIELSSVGKALPQVKIEIRDEQQQVLLSAGKVGTVWIKGPGLMKGQIQKKGGQIVTDFCDFQGFYNTGDLGFLDEESHLYICGRQKDVIIINGRNLSPAIIEEHLGDELPFARKGHIVATSYVNMKEPTEQLVLLIELSKDYFKQKDKELYFDEWKEKVKRLVLRDFFLKVSKVELLAPGSLPKTTSGKLQRGAAKKLWSQNDLKPKGQSKVFILWTIFKTYFNDLMIFKGSSN